MIFRKTKSAKDRMLDYLLKESHVGIRMMFEKGSALHAFNYGKHPDGRDFVFVMAVLPHDVASRIFEVNKWEDEGPGLREVLRQMYGPAANAEPNAEANPAGGKEE